VILASKSNKYALFWTFLVYYKWDVLAGVLPRLAYTGFIFSQPFLVHRVLTFIEEPEDINSKNIAYGLIGAYALVYIGIAVCQTPVCRGFDANSESSCPMPSINTRCTVCSQSFAAV
jgi:hypothetical protein